MKINEVEALAGITKKNIRFYESQGLLTPRRNSENGYREYAQADVQALLRIKLMRKLGVPIEEIRRMLAGEHTVADGIRRHLVSLERQQQNTAQSIALCRSLQDQEIWLTQLDAGQILDQMQQFEQTGTAFSNKQEQDIRPHYLAPVSACAIIIVLMLAIAFLICRSYWTHAENALPLLLVILLVALCLTICGGIILALRQRIREIRSGETEDAKKY